MPQTRLVHRQYRDASRLDARIGLHERYGVSLLAWQTWVFDNLDLPESCSLLETGCGPADLWRLNGNRIPDGWAVTLTDQSTGMLRDARTRLAEAGARSLSSAVADAQSIPFGDSRFDAVVANHMLYHVIDVDAALTEVARVLRPGGQLYASTVGLSHMRELFDAARSASSAAAATRAPKVQSFSLEHGGAVLERFFDTVRLEIFDNPLEVDDAGDLMDYLQSTETGSAMSTFERLVCRRQLQSVIDRDGTFHISTSTGLYVATMTEGAK